MQAGTRARSGAIVATAALLLSALGVLGAPPASAAVAPTTRAITSGNADSFGSSVTPDGHLVLFSSRASDLGDAGGGTWTRAYLYNVDTGTTELLLAGNADVHATAISDDGRYVTIQSDATGLVPGTAPGVHDYQFDRQTKALVLLFDPSQQTESPDTSADGRFIVFEHGPSFGNLRLWDRTTGVAEDLGGGSHPTVSDDGRYVAFTGEVAGTQQVFTLDRSTHVTTQVTAGNDRTILAGTTPDGRFLTLLSDATDLVPGGTTGENVFVWDRTTGTTTAETTTGGSLATGRNLSDDGRYLLLGGDGTPPSKAVLRDRTTGTSTALDAGPGRQEQGVALSPDGRFATFNGDTPTTPPSGKGTDLQSYLYDRVTGATLQLTHGHGDTAIASLSADGRRILFGSNATDQVPGRTTSPHTNVFLVDRGPSTDQLGRFVDAAYADLLHRAPSAAERSNLVAALDAGTTTRTKVVDELASSPEWVTALVQRLYQDTLGRPGDPGGVTYWVGEIRAHRRTVANVAANLYASDEYFTHQGGGTLAHWVADLYPKLLHRAPDAAGQQYWVARAARNGRFDVALAFFQSAESAHTRVVDLYQDLLGRAPDPAGAAYWAGRVVVVGDLVLARNLAASDEYLRRAQARFP